MALCQLAYALAHDLERLSQPGCGVEASKFRRSGLHREFDSQQPAGASRHCPASLDKARDLAEEPHNTHRHSPGCLKNWLAKVNCTSDLKNSFESDPSISYFRFAARACCRKASLRSEDIYKFFQMLDLRTHQGVAEFFHPVFSWIDDAVAQGPRRTREHSDVQEGRS